MTAPAVVPLGKTIFGITVWAVLPGRTPGQRDGLRHLTWSGPGDAVHLCKGGRAGSAGDRREYPGRDAAAVSGPCRTGQEAAAAAQAWAAAQTEPVSPALAAVAATASAPHLTYAQALETLKDLYQRDPARGSAWTETGDIEQALYWAGHIGTGYLGAHVITRDSAGCFRIALNPGQAT